MAHKHLATYLNDHLAGSTTLIELLRALQATHAYPDLQHFASELRAEVEADRRELESLMHRLAIPESMPRRAAGWVTERLTDIKLHLDDSSNGEFRWFEALELIELGIRGKRLLWESLAAAADESSILQGLDYPRLIQRAQEQYRRVDALRLQLAKTALGSPPKSRVVA